MKEKKKEPKTGFCQKCNVKFYIHHHHIFPKAFFGEKGETVALCPNCHTHCHVYLSQNVNDMNNAKEVKAAWIKWITEIDPVVKILIAVLLVSSLIYFVH